MTPTWPSRGDHPRSRGVYLNSNSRITLSRGSSPLARGLHEVGGELDGLQGIIPARAGFTPPHSPQSAPHSDHPRSRGVYSSPLITSKSAAGSSPLARGLPVSFVAAGFQNRIIPARAGFTPDGPQSFHGLPDHPRSRGVYEVAQRMDVVAIGSSPLARGLPQRGHQRPGVPRIIPARAGFTWWGASFVLPMPDHPRSRGVYRLYWSPVHVPTGSSPLARGLRNWLRASESFDRIIPARAGFTPRCFLMFRCWRDHPRSRGVYW